MSSLNNKLFEEHFAQIYGPRWTALRKALGENERQVLRANFFSGSPKAGAERCEFLPHAYWKPEGYKLEKDDQGLYPFYVMDPASVLVARALDPQASDEVLDLCAAPGGKTLVLAEQMSAQGEVEGSLTSNEVSDGRRERLMRVLHEYIPKEKRMFIHVKGLDGNQYGLRQPDIYDRVLADVPCSGERHLLENPKEFEEWSVKRTKNLAVRQYSLLSSAWLATKAGGRIVYSTCSISPHENDDVVAKLLKKRRPQILRPSWLDDLKFVEKTAHGYQILPDTSGFGPMYFSVIEKS